MEPRKKVAILGSAPSSIDLAPFEDLDWDIWACSPSAVDHLKRCNAFFELHPFIPGADNMRFDYLQWMSIQGCPIYMQETQPNIPTSQPFPFEELMNVFGPFFFTSSIAWMMAFAMMERGETLEEIGLWGVDMAAAEEYREQRPGCHHFIQHASDRGIRITVPPQSDLLRPPRPYGLSLSRPADIKMRVRLGELQDELAKAEAMSEESTRNLFFLRGCIEELKFNLRTEAE